jgi:hypothetical protein
MPISGIVPPVGWVQKEKAKLNPKVQQLTMGAGTKLTHLSPKHLKGFWNPQKMHYGQDCHNGRFMAGYRA